LQRKVIALWPYLKVMLHRVTFLDPGFLPPKLPIST
jgi:hypothetical protein